MTLEPDRPEFLRFLMDNPLWGMRISGRVHDFGFMKAIMLKRKRIGYPEE
jgi:hypothetical protein